MNKQWCASKECEYEFNIALRTSFTNNGVPAFVPLLLEQFSVYKTYLSSLLLLLVSPLLFSFSFFFLIYSGYPIIHGFLCSTNGMVVTEHELSNATWGKISNIVLAKKQGEEQIQGGRTWSITQSKEREVSKD